MTHPEQTVASAIKAAIRDGRITGAPEENVFTTADAVGQWEGANKIYAVPVKTEPVGDMLSGDASSGFHKTELSLTCLGADIGQADALISEVLPVAEAAMESAGMEAVLTGLEGVHRFEAGSWKDEYYQVRTFNVYHQ